MKRSILIGFFLIVVGIAYSQEANQSQNALTATETERIIDKYIDKAGEALDNLAQTLKVPAEHVYSVLIQQQRVEGLLILIALITSLVLTSLSVWLAYYFSEKDAEGGLIAFFIVSIVFGVLFIISGIDFFTNTLPHWINPEYGAIQEIIKVF